MTARCASVPPPAQWRVAFLAVAALVLHVVLDAIFPLGYRRLIDRAIAPRDLHRFAVVMTGLGAAFVVFSLVIVARERLFADLGGAGEIVLFRFFEPGPQCIIAGVGLTSLLGCTAMEYVIPRNRAWNYFTHASGMRWWMFGSGASMPPFSSATTPIWTSDRAGSGRS